MKFEFFLAEQLHMTVGRLRSEMSNDEFVRWGIYFGMKAQEQELQQQAMKKGR